MVLVLFFPAVLSEHTRCLTCFSPLTNSNVYLTLHLTIQFLDLLPAFRQPLLSINFRTLSLVEPIDHSEHLTGFIFCQSYIDAW